VYNIIKPIIVIVVVLVLTPIIIQMFGGAAEVAGQTFNQTIDVGGTQYNLGGVAKLLLMLAGIFVPLALLEKYMR